MRNTMLDAFDPETALGGVYAALVRQPGATADDVAATRGCAAAEALELLAVLVEQNLALRLDDTQPARWDARPPDDIAEDMEAAERARLRVLRNNSRRLAGLYRFARREAGHYPGIEVLTNASMAAAQFTAMQQSARDQVRAFDRPPYLSSRLPELGDDGGTAAQSNLQSERMAAGVVYRTVYYAGVYQQQAQLAAVMAAVADGEHARVLENPPMKLVIADESSALLPLDPANAADGATLIVHPSGLLDALIAIFETLWDLAVPFSLSDGHDPLDDRDRGILTLMAAGATDDAIARRLGLSRRTVVRHTGALLERLGATTRFQAGVQAARRGWL